MVVDTISTPLISFAGSGVAGFFMGMLLRRVLHIVLIIVGSFLGALFLAIQFMANKGYLGNAQIDWTRIGNDTAASFQGLYTQFSSQHVFGALGIPATSGRVKVDQVERSYDFVIPGAKVFATANNINRLSRPLQSRFRKLFLPQYSEEQFLQVAIKVLPKLKEETVGIIAAQVWSTSKDVRDVISVGKLIRRSDTEQDVKQILGTLTKYGG